MADPNDTGIGVNPLGFGVCNEYIKPQVRDLYDQAQTNPINTMAKIAGQSFIPNVLNATGPYKGVVLRKYEIGSTPAAEGFLQKLGERLFGSDDVAVLSAIKVQIPEIHSCHPYPSQFDHGNPEDKGPHQKIIDMYPTFVATDDMVPSPQIGDLVWVDFIDKTEHRAGIYLRPVHVSNQNLSIAENGPATTAPFEGQANSTPLGSYTPEGEWRMGGQPAAPKVYGPQAIGKGSFKKLPPHIQQAMKASKPRVIEIAIREANRVGIPPWLLLAMGDMEGGLMHGPPYVDGSNRDGSPSNSWRPYGFKQITAATARGSVWVKRWHGRSGGAEEKRIVRDQLAVELGDLEIVTRDAADILAVMWRRNKQDIDVTRINWFKSTLAKKTRKKRKQGNSNYFPGWYNNYRRKKWRGLVNKWRTRYPSGRA